MDGQAYGWNNSKGNISILTKIIRILRDLDHDDTHFSKYVSNLINGYRDMALDSQKIPIWFMSRAITPTAMPIFKK